MKRLLMNNGWLVAVLLTTVALRAQDQAGQSEPLTESTSQPEPSPKKPHEIVREGNQLLLDGKAAEALDRYLSADQLQPGAREIAFGRGLAHYELGAYEDARMAFEEAVGLQDDTLSHDAVYSLGTCDHAEALSQMETNPQEAMSQLESAMNRYREVLANRPKHKAALDANKKAATLWRQMKLQQKKQEQQQDSDEKKDDQQQDQEKQESKDQQSNDQESQDENQDQQQSDPSEDEKKDQQQQEQQSKSEEEQKDQQEQQQPQAQEQKESQEQAQRKLREMMQNLRQRQKKRRQPVQRIPVHPTEKDW